MKRGNLPLLYLTSATSMVFGILYVTLLPQFTEVKGYDDLFYGILIAIYMSAFVVMSIPGGHLSDKIGRKHTLFIGWSIQAVTPLLMSLSSHWIVLIIASVIWSLGSGFSHNAFGAMIADSVKIDKLSSSCGDGGGILC